MPEKFPTGTSDKASHIDKISEKQQKWEKQRKETEEWRDALGKPIDEKIKDSVVAFNAWQMPTGSSCEGHLDGGYPAPWVQIEAPNRPAERFIGEREFFQKIADKYDIPIEDVVRGNNEKAWIEAVSGPYLENGETPEYLDWRKKMMELEAKANDLLREFYKNKEVPKNIRLEIDRGGEGMFRIHNGGEDYEPIHTMPEEQKKGLEGRLKQYQAEMQEFTKFLKEKYFSEGK